MNESAHSQALRGKRIAILENRENAHFSELLAGRGAVVLSCPLLEIADAPGRAAVHAWIRKFNAGAFQDAVFMTGEGVRRLARAAGEMGASAEFAEALKRTRKITRGPKPARALAELGVKGVLAAPEPTTAGLIAALSKLDLAGRTVGVQLFGEDPSEPLIAHLKSAQAIPEPVISYIYAPRQSDAEPLELLRKMAAGEADMLALTSVLQFKRLAEIAEKHAAAALLREAFVKTPVAPVGPVIAEELAARGIPISIPPTAPFVLKHLIAAMCAYFTQH